MLRPSDGFAHTTEYDPFLFFIRFSHLQDDIVLKTACRNSVLSASGANNALPMPTAITSILSKSSSHRVGSWIGWIFDLNSTFLGNLINPSEWEKKNSAIFGLGCVGMTMIILLGGLSYTNQYRVVKGSCWRNSRDERIDLKPGYPFCLKICQLHWFRRKLQLYHCLNNARLLGPTYKKHSMYIEHFFPLIVYEEKL